MPSSTSPTPEITVEELVRYDTQAGRLLGVLVLMDGKAITRHDLEEQKIAPNAADLSALACRAERLLLVPISRARLNQSPMLMYWVDGEDSRRYLGHGQRERQKKAVPWAIREPKHTSCLKAVDHLAADCAKGLIESADTGKQAIEKLEIALELGRPAVGGAPTTGQKQPDLIPDTREEGHASRSNE